MIAILLPSVPYNFVKCVLDCVAFSIGLWKSLARAWSSLLEVTPHVAFLNCNEFKSFCVECGITDMCVMHIQGMLELATAMGDEICNLDDEVG